MSTCIYKRWDLRERQSSLWFHEITSAHVISGDHQRANPSSSLKHAGLNITIYLLVPKFNQDMVWSCVNLQTDVLPTWRRHAAAVWAEATYHPFTACSRRLNSFYSLKHTTGLLLLDLSIWLFISNREKKCHMRQHWLSVICTRLKWCLKLYVA